MGVLRLLIGGRLAVDVAVWFPRWVQSLVFSDPVVEAPDRAAQIVIDSLAGDS